MMFNRCEVQRYLLSFLSFFAFGGEEEGDKLTTGDGQEVTDIGLGRGKGSGEEATENITKLLLRNPKIDKNS